MLSFGTVKLMLATNSAVEVLVALGPDDDIVWSPTHLNNGDQNSHEYEGEVSPGDVNALHNRTLRVAVKNVDKLPVPFSLVTLLPLPSCTYERVALNTETSVRSGFHRWLTPKMNNP